MMNYYVSVDRKRSTTKLGLKLAELVARKLDAALLTKEQADAIPDWLTGVIEQLCAENKRFTPMEVRTNGYKTVDGSKCLACDGCNAQIYAVTASGAKAFEDNRPFTLYLHPIKRDHTAVSVVLREYEEAVIMGRSKLMKAVENIKAAVDALETAFIEFGKVEAKIKEGGKQ